ncbi:hypothetical protein B0T16DRAFT_422588 [Cercophora newfieldiana]|uniref:Uncharacterized protein n=1 Tax=Cercophora newfieldiana TaxID=92897 RepID=A0AA40CI10_9PEZI|nr:hypothetical protein B0T16DRAFT_422588 [Cercophora newfieldiana]
MGQTRKKCNTKSEKGSKKKRCPPVPERWSRCHQSRAPTLTKEDQKKQKTHGAMYFPSPASSRTRNSDNRHNYAAPQPAAQKGNAQLLKTVGSRRHPRCNSPPHCRSSPHRVVTPGQADPRFRIPHSWDHARRSWSVTVGLRRAELTSSCIGCL